MVSIFCMSWNTQSVRIGEHLEQRILQQHREGYLTGYHWTCSIPDFYPPLEERIKQNNYDILIFSFQEDASPGSYFHSHLLPSKLPELGYSLVRRTKMMGVGITTVKALKQGDILTRGLRMSIYAKSNLAKAIMDNDMELAKDLQGSLVRSHIHGSKFTRGKGAVAIYLRIPLQHKTINLAVLNAHLPFDSKSLIDTVVKQQPMIRHNAVLEQDQAYNDIYRTLVADLPIKMNAILYMGDLNYRVTPLSEQEYAEMFSSGPGLSTTVSLAKSLMLSRFNDESHVYKRLYREYDELLQEMNKGNIYPLLEGIDNDGPLFLPTCKLYKNRPDLVSISDANAEGGIFKTGILHQRTPSWCDRILYRGLDCLEYDRYDQGTTMKQSDHAAILGVYTVE